MKARKTPRRSLSEMLSFVPVSNAVIEAFGSLSQVDLAKCNDRENTKAIRKARDRFFEQLVLAMILDESFAVEVCKEIAAHARENTNLRKCMNDELKRKQAHPTKWTNARYFMLAQEIDASIAAGETREKALQDAARGHGVSVEKLEKTHLAKARKVQKDWNNRPTTST